MKTVYYGYGSTLHKHIGLIDDMEETIIDVDTATNLSHVYDDMYNVLIDFGTLYVSNNYKKLFIDYLMQEGYQLVSQTGKAKQYALYELDGSVFNAITIVYTNML